MGKLIKYEWRKQRTARIFILICLAVFLLSFAAGMIGDNAGAVGISIIVLAVAGVFGIFYIGIESIVILNKDLRTKQSQMLFMVPHSVWEILGAKVIAAVLQMLFVFLMFFAAISVTVSVTAAYNTSIGELFQAIGRGMNYLTNGSVDWFTVFWLCGLMLISWISTIMIGFLAVILSRTVLLKSRFAGAFSIVLFLMINIAVGKLYNVAVPSDIAQIASIPEFTWLDYGFYILVCVLVFFAAGQVADKKLSV